MRRDGTQPLASEEPTARQKSLSTGNRFPGAGRSKWPRTFLTEAHSLRKACTVMRLPPFAAQHIDAEDLLEQARPGSAGWRGVNCARPSPLTPPSNPKSPRPTRLRFCQRLPARRAGKATRFVEMSFHPFAPSDDSS